MGSNLKGGYFEDEDNDGQEDSEPVHAPQIIPHRVILLVRHPGPWHENEEQDIHY